MQLIKRYLKEVDWIFLIFLLIFLNQSIFSLKIIGILFIYIARPNFKFKLFKGAIPPFYYLIILLSVINFFVIGDFSTSYIVAFLLSASLWVFCILAFHQINLFIQNSVGKREGTIKAFTVLNILFSGYQLIKMMMATGQMNPYKGLDFPYGLSAGDNIYGIFLQNSYYNVMVSAFLVIYFLYRRNALFSILAVVPLVLVFANTATLVLILVLLIIFFLGVLYRLFRKSAQEESSIMQGLLPRDSAHLKVPLIVGVIIGLSCIVSLENVSYTFDSLVKKVNQKISTSDQAKLNELQTASTSGKKDEHTTAKNADTAALRMQYTVALSEKEQLTRDYLYQFKGKKLSFVETGQYLRSSPAKLLLGAGPIRFSSVTAQRMCGFDSSRLFLKVLPRFVSKEYSENHMLLIKARREAGPEYRSAINWPDSFYNQIFGEYGLIGALLFAIFYVGFFMKKIRRWSYGFWISILLVWFALFSYLFEAFSVIIIYELLMQLDVNDHTKRSAAGNGINAGV